MEKVKAPTMASIQSDVKWTKYYIDQIREAKRAGDYASAAEWADCISAIWATISGEFNEADNNA